jgi:spermidine synthase
MSTWFTEEDLDEIRVSYRIEKVLLETQSPFQTIQVAESKPYGRMLILDGVVQTTDRDEFVYHEMIAHVPLCYHPNPEKVLVIGGGDGGTVREILQHPCVKEVTLCEIDGKVVDVSKQFFPQHTIGLSDPRVRVHIADGIAYMNELEPASLDVLIVDSSDPIGPGEGLFTADFYRAAAKALRPNGILVAQTESPWLPASILQRIYGNIRAGFQTVRPYTGPVPTYQRGFWSWTLATNGPAEGLVFQKDRCVALQTQYLTPALASVILEATPPFYLKKLKAPIL